MAQSRRQFLKFMSAAPLIFPLGLTASPIMRFLKPTAGPLGLFDQPDQPEVAEPLAFTVEDFPVPWTCIPFMLPLKYIEFNPEQQVIRQIPGFIIRTSGNQFVAFSRICPIRHGYVCILNWIPEPDTSCGCSPKAEQCCCTIKVNNPVLQCPCTRSVFDPADGGRVLRGPAHRPPRKIELEKRQDKITILGIETGSIA